MDKTLREKFIIALEKMGETKVKETHKFVVYTRVAGGYYYVGRSGSLRIGKNQSTSFPAVVMFKSDLLKLAEQC